ncbi:hypothetical protein VHUM_03840 [Vanrija humicola]|uniref:Uncharacterized protein n=1 Tax=Vanrija humicola TaxID=5417 RepID=A0A7D8YWZ3_VANHU|nr:hypothetical protein VHUM_03840 [Vanrija humicola]
MALQLEQELGRAPPAHDSRPVHRRRVCAHDVSCTHGRV